MTDKIIYRPGIKADLAVQTVEDITLYVRSDGDDSNSGLSASDALATVQEAIDRIPKFIRHNVTIDIGEGSFGPLSVGGFSAADNSVTLTIQGTLGTPTLTTGTTSGTATGGSTTQLIDSGQNWTTNELRGMLVLVDGEYRVVRENTSTTIDFAGEYGNSVNGKSYSILEQKTSLSGTVSGGYGPAEARSNNANIELKNLKMSGGTVTLYVLYNTAIVRLRQLHVSSGTYNIVLAYSAGRNYLYDLYSTGSSSFGTYMTDCSLGGCEGFYSYNDGSSAGFGMGWMSRVSIKTLYIDSSNGDGIVVYYCPGLDILTNIEVKNSTKNGMLVGSGYINLNKGTFENNGEYGVVLATESSNEYQADCLNGIGTLVIKNNASGGLFADNMSLIALSNCTGTGNGGYGIKLHGGARAVISSATSVTGSSGDITIDDGDSTLSYSSDFAADGDIVANLTNGCRIERKD